MSVATLNPFELLNEEVKTVKSVKTTTTTAAPAKTVAPVAAAKTAAPATAGKPKRTENKNKKSAAVGELNAEVSEKTPLRRNNNNSRRAPAAPGNERQERRRTDRHSRSGYKQDGEKRMTGGKGSWGKAVEGGEQHVSVDESVAIVEQVVESLEISEEAATEAVAEPVVPHLTLAQYQASLKKPVAATSAPRKVTTTLPAAQILKKETEVFVFPEIVKKAPVAKKSAAVAAEKSVGVDVSKYISVKAVGSVEPRVERAERSDRDRRDSRDNRNNRNNNNNNNRNSTNNNNKTQQQQSATKLNLKDDRSFPTLGSK